jgi:hypothetical protein
VQRRARDPVAGPGASGERGLPEEGGVLAVSPCHVALSPTLGWLPTFALWRSAILSRTGRLDRVALVGGLAVVFPKAGGNRESAAEPASQLGRAAQARFHNACVLGVSRSARGPACSRYERLSSSVRSEPKGADAMSDPCQAIRQEIAELRDEILGAQNELHSLEPEDPREPGVGSAAKAQLVAQIKRLTDAINEKEDELRQCVAAQDPQLPEIEIEPPVVCTLTGVAMVTTANPNFRGPFSLNISATLTFGGCSKSRWRGAVDPSARSLPGRSLWFRVLSDRDNSPPRDDNRNVQPSRKSDHSAGYARHPGNVSCHRDGSGGPTVFLCAIG